MLRCVLSTVLLVIACGGKAKPPPAAPEIELTGPATFAGSWVTADDMDWGYHLAITAEGGLLLTIDRGKMGRCEQRGTLEPGAAPREYTLVYAKNTCDPDATVGPLTLTVASFTGGALTIVVRGPGRERRRSYSRDPMVPITSE